MAGLHDWLARLPKVELHLHLEGAIPHAALFALIGKYGGDPTVASVEDIARKFRFRDFPHFIEMWIWKNGFLRGYDDFAFIAEAMARDLARQNVRHAEVFFSPGRFYQYDLATQPLAEAIRRGLDRVPEVSVLLIADLVRDLGPQQAAETLEQVHEVAAATGIVGIGIGGSEHAHPPEPFAPVYARARKLGYRTTAHAGEAAGPASIRGALDALQVERIGHGVRAEEDPALLDELAARQVPLELCPLSNVATGVTARIEDHPFRRYFDRGLKVTLSTDDPGMFGNELNREYALLADVFGFTPDEIRQVVRNGVDACWLSDDRRAALRRAIEADPAWQGPA